MTARLPKKRKRSLAFKILAWAVLGYVVIATLHGLAPQLWRRHFSDNDDNGPFRILLFTSFIVPALVGFVLEVLLIRRPASLSVIPPPRAAFHSPCLLRGPPLPF